MTGPIGWPPLRRRPHRLGKHRALETISESQMPPVTPASLPQHDYRASMPLRPIAVATAVESEPERTVRCGYCNAVNYVSQMRDVPDRPRCADVIACTRRWADGARPVSLVPHGAEALEPLPGAGPEPESSTSLTSGNVIRDSRNSRSDGGPEIQPDAVVDEHLAVFNAAHDEQDAAEGKDGSEDEGPASLPDVPGPGAVPRDEPTAATGGQHDGTAHASTGRSEVNPGPGTPAPPPAGTTEPAPVAAETEPEEGGESE